MLKSRARLQGRGIRARRLDMLAMESASLGLKQRLETGVVQDASADTFARVVERLEKKMQKAVQEERRSTDAKYKASRGGYVEECLHSDAHHTSRLLRFPKARTSESTNDSFN